MPGSLEGLIERRVLGEAVAILKFAAPDGTALLAERGVDPGADVRR